MDDLVRDKDGFVQLVPKCSNLYKRINYHSPAELVLNRIYEYDLRSANTSALRASGTLKPATLIALEELPKHDREVMIGKMIQKNPAIRDVIVWGVSKAKMKLFMANHVQSEEVQAIRNDAVCIIGRRLPRTQFGSFVFRETVYSVYMVVEKIEFYYNRKSGVIDVKGIKDPVVQDPDHQKGILVFIRTVMDHLLMDRRDALRRYLIQFSCDYKEKKLPVEYYKEFSRENIYRSLMDLNGWTFNRTAASEKDKPDLNGVYNYKRFVLPLIQKYV